MGPFLFGGYTVADREHLHAMTAQILSSVCQSGSRVMQYDKGEDLGAFLGEAYAALYKRIADVDDQAGPPRELHVTRTIVDARTPS